ESATRGCALVCHAAAREQTGLMATATLNLDSSVQYLKGVGPARGELLAKLGVHTVGDLLFHFPRSYDDLSDIRGIGALTGGILQTVHGDIVEMEGKSLPDGRQILSIVIADPQGKCVE